MSKKSKKKHTSPQAKAANRQNAQKSTGPQSAPGKAISAQNSLKHGLTAQKFQVLSWEDQAAFDAFQQDLIETYAPETGEEEAALMQVIHTQWRINRIHALEDMALNACTDRPDEISKQIREFSRYHVNLQRLLEKAYQLLNYLIEGRNGQTTNPQSPYSPKKDQIAQYKKQMQASRQAALTPMVPMDQASVRQRWEEYKATLSPEERAKVQE